MNALEVGTAMVSHTSFHCSNLPIRHHTVKIELTSKQCQNISGRILCWLVESYPEILILVCGAEIHSTLRNGGVDYKFYEATTR